MVKIYTCGWGWDGLLRRNCESQKKQRWGLAYACLFIMHVLGGWLRDAVKWWNWYVHGNCASFVLSFNIILLKNKLILSDRRKLPIKLRRGILRGTTTTTTTPTSTTTTTTTTTPTTIITCELNSGRIYCSHTPISYKCRILLEAVWLWN